MLATAADSLTATVDFRPEAPYYRQGSWQVDTSSDWDDPRLNLAQTEAHREAALLKIVESLTDLAAEPYVEPAEQHARKQGDIARKYLKAFRAAKARIMELKADACAEGYSVSDASENDLLAFLNNRVFTRRPFITLLDNGNLRALWKNAEGEQIGLQFRGGKQVQYVLFARRENEGFMARASGRDSLANIDRHIEVHNLGRLMAA